MSLQYPSGLITKNPVIPSGPYDTDTASGVWTLDEQAYWNKLGLWPTAGNAPKDAQFNYVTMLLHGDGTNGAQNNTFLDSSASPLTLTRNGDTTQGSFSPFGSNWSNYFSGSGSVSYSNVSTALQFPGDFTVEGWFNLANFNNATAGGNPGLIGAGTGNWLLVIPGGAYNFYASGALILTSSAVASANIWNHFALVRSGSTLTIYHNGVSVGTATNSATLSIGTSVTVGSNGTGGIGSITGYISNVRVVKGTAVYTAAFTPPTAPLTAISGTQLLAAQANRFKDSSVNNFTITVEVGPAIRRLNPFGASTAYSTAVIGGSGYFDGTGDYLSTPNVAALQPGTSTNPFCVECWIYPLATPAADTAILGNLTVLSYPTNCNGFDLLHIPTNEVALRWGYPNYTDSGVSPAMALNTWNHIAVCRNSSGSMSCYLNGTRWFNTSSNTSITNATASSFWVGWAGSLSGSTINPFNGYISNARLVNGSAVYDPTSSTLTVPTAPLTAITNTSLLTNFINGAIFDNAMINNLETNGNAQISTSVVKYGTGSIAFDGTGDFLRFPKLGTLDFGTGDFTIEMWVNPSANQTSYSQLINKGATESFQLNFLPSTTTLGFYAFSFLFTASTALTIGAWTHVALVRNSGTLTLYQGGISVGSATYTTNVTDDYGHIGCDVGETQYFYNGYLDDIRITKGVARYTGTFTPPTAAFLNIGPN